MAEVAAVAVLAAVAVVGCSSGGVGGGVRSSGKGGADCVDDFYGKGAVGSSRCAAVAPAAEVAPIVALAGPSRGGGGNPPSHQPPKAVVTSSVGH